MKHDIKGSARYAEKASRLSAQPGQLPSSPCKRVTKKQGAGKGELQTSGLSSSTCLDPTSPFSSGSVGCDTTAGGKGSVHVVGLWKVVVNL